MWKAHILCVMTAINRIVWVAQQGAEADDHKGALLSSTNDNITVDPIKKSRLEDVQFVRLFILCIPLAIWWMSFALDPEGNQGHPGVGI